MGSGAKPQRTTILVLFEHLERLFLALYFRDNYYISQINATGNPRCTLFNSECTISAGNTLRIGAGNECLSAECIRGHVTYATYLVKPAGGNDEQISRQLIELQVRGFSRQRIAFTVVHLERINHAAAKQSVTRTYSHNCINMQQYKLCSVL